MPLDRRQKVALGAGTAGVVAVAGTVAWLLTRNKLGRLQCPGRAVVTERDLENGDFVALQLTSKDGTFSEPTWGVVRRHALVRGIRVELVGPIDERLAAVPLQTDRHGYALGDTVTISAACVWDAYRPPSGQAQLVCGAGLSAVPEGFGVPREPDPRARHLRAGDEAAVVLAAGGQPVEMVWLEVLGLSAGNQVITGQIIEDTIFPETHGFEQGDKIQFVRDCVVQARLTGG